MLQIEADIKTVIDEPILSEEENICIQDIWTAEVKKNDKISQQLWRKRLEFLLKKKKKIGMMYVLSTKNRRTRCSDRSCDLMIFARGLWSCFYQSVFSWSFMVGWFYDKIDMRWCFICDGDGGVFFQNQFILPRTAANREVISIFALHFVKRTQVTLQGECISIFITSWGGKNWMLNLKFVLFWKFLIKSMWI